MTSILRLFPCFIFLIFGLSCHEKNQENQISKQKLTPQEFKFKKKETSDYLHIDYLMGKFNPSLNPNFQSLEPPFSDRKRWLRKEAATAFIQMHNAARIDGVTLIVKSAARNFDYQKMIWEKKWNGKTLLNGITDASKVYPNAKNRALAILEYSSMPGTSRHHWGTDIDMNAFTNTYFEKGNGLKEYDWLVNNAENFGFCQVYTTKGAERPTGYEEEKWHWTYIPIARPLTQFAKDNFNDSLIVGFEGSHTAVSIRMLENFVLGINNHCK